MNESLKKLQKSGHRWLPVLFFVLFMVCTGLLSACSLPGTNGIAYASQTDNPGVLPTPSPTVSAILQKQGDEQLQTFQEWIALLKQYGGNTDQYQRQYTSDQRALTAAQTNSAYQDALTTLNGHVATIKLPALKTEAESLQSQLSQEANAWSSQHTYYDSYDGNTYNLGYEYQGIVNYPARELLDSAQTIADYQYAISQLDIWLANFDAYKANFSDKTPYNQVHQTDLQLMKQYGYTSGQVLVISLSEQAMRVYQDGKLVNSFLVVTGMPSHPSLPGTWWIESRETNITFTSGLQPDQDGYYPPTPIAYAMQYHSGGYFIHQSWWRSQYGPDNQFPHVDPNGTAFAYEGSHGCINMSTSDVEWVYNFVQVNTTKIIIY